MIDEKIVPETTEPAGSEVPKPDELESKTQETKSYTQEDIDKIISKRLERERTKIEKTMMDKISEAEKLAKMTAEERKEAEFQSKMKEIEEKEKKYQAWEMKTKAEEILKENNVPVSLSDFVVKGTAEETMESAKLIKQVWESELEKAINEKLKGKIPITGNSQQLGMDSDEAKLRKYMGL